ncbi:glycosylation-dependent cell adhesion molecule 1-like [Nannospalax galili]|uniref:glycosylation-dependent cell adhesion molecule 1-like n=1 Tax=Nannospalax galili TaxID=1026970 RepID=UPI00111C011A|nr:glycosylation-dependent cell adhesion molecule 1-like [Nannospalax galili]
MKFFIILLLGSLTYTSLGAVLPGPGDELHVKTQSSDTVPAAQFTPTSQASKEHASSEDPSKEPFFFREVISSDDVVIEYPKPKSHKAQSYHSPLQGSPKSATFQSEETTGLTPTAGMSREEGKSTTSEEKLAKISHAMGKDLDKMVKVLTNYAEGMIPGSNGIVKP